MRSIGALLIVAILVSGAESLLAQEKKAIPILPKTAPTNQENPIKKLQRQVRKLQGQVESLQAEVGKNSEELKVIKGLVAANSGQISQTD